MEPSSVRRVPCVGELVDIRLNNCILVVLVVLVVLLEVLVVFFIFIVDNDGNESFLDIGKEEDVDDGRSVDVVHFLGVWNPISFEVFFEIDLDDDTHIESLEDERVVVRAWREDVKTGIGATLSICESDFELIDVSIQISQHHTNK